MNFANAANLVPIKVAWSRILVFGWVRLVERTRIVQFAESIHVFSKLLLVFDRVDGGMVVKHLAVAGRVHEDSLEVVGLL